MSPPMRCALKYVGPLDSASGEKLLRSMAYLTSYEVIGEPSSYFRPYFRVYVHVYASALGLPSDSARSGTTSRPAPPASGLKLVSVRP